MAELTYQARQLLILYLLLLKKYSLLYYKFPDFMLEIYKMNITENIETEEL